MAGITVVTLYDTLGKDSIDYILNQTKDKTIVCAADKIRNLLEIKNEGKIEDLTHIVHFDDAKKEDQDFANEVGITLIRLEDVIKEGSNI